MAILITVLIFGLMVLVHELGHFLLAKKNGIGVVEFSIGMGPRLFFRRAGRHQVFTENPSSGRLLCHEGRIGGRGRGRLLPE